MKVLLTTDYYPPHFGGGAEATLPVVVRGLADRGHEVRVVTLNTDAAPAQERRDGAIVYRAPTHPVDRYVGLQLSLSPSLPALVTRLVRRFSPDIIWAHNHFFTTALAAHWASARTGVPVLTDLSLADVSFLPRLKRSAALAWEKTVSRWMLRRSAVLTGVSRACVAHGKELVGRKPVEGVVVPNGVDTRTFRPAGGQVSPPVVGFVGRLISNKGPQRLVEAIPDVLACHPQARFVFVGDGPLKRALLDRVQRLGVGHAVTFKGVVPHECIPQELRQMSMVVRPSDTEGLPVIALEAMASGIPLIATDVGGTREVLEHGKTGLLLPPDPLPDAVARAVRYLLKSPQTMFAMGRAAREASASLDWSRCVDLREQVLLDYARRT